MQYDGQTGQPIYPNSQQDPDGRPYSVRSRLAAILLAFFFGYLGIHRLYCGKTLSGLLMLIGFPLSYLASFILIGYPFLILIEIVHILDLVRLILGTFRDGQGRLVKNW